MRQDRLEGLILLVVALVVVTVDQLTKSWIVTSMEWGQSVDLTSWLAPVLRLTYVTNTGAAFGLLQGWGDFFLIVAVIVVGLLLVYYRHLPGGHFLLRLALGFQLGGAMGNLIDRIARGSVVDFIDLNFWPMHAWPIFNLADASIVTGVGLLVLTMLGDRENRE